MTFDEKGKINKLKTILIWIVGLTSSLGFLVFAPFIYAVKKMNDYEDAFEEAEAEQMEKESEK